jgi:gamma-glutamyltranspeptidase / glutathione hydrolase
MLHNPYGYRASRRSVVMAPHGMVATSQPLAAQAGIDILKSGGNAIDAAIAVNATLGVVEPMSCGIGGDLFAIVWDAKSQSLSGLNASGRSPYAASIDYFTGKGYEYIPDKGPLNWSVPGCVDGWECLLNRFGSKSYRDILSTAIDYAENGFPVSDIISRDWSESTSLISPWPGSVKAYMPNGESPKAGDVFKNPDLARSYRALADGGRDAFYAGDITDLILAYSDEIGGLFSKADFSDHFSTWDDPVNTDYRGYTVWELPPNGQGIAALQMLNILEGFDLQGYGYQTTDTLHLQIEAKKLAYADRAVYYSDMAFTDVPVQELISKGYADTQRERIDPRKAMMDVAAGDPILKQGDTVYLTVVDKDRNAVSFIQSIFRGFGSGIVPPGTGFPIQNRGQLFALDPQHRNALHPHKRPFQTIIPAMVTKDNKPLISLGLMGGDMQPQGHAQVLCNFIDFGMDIQEAGDAPRFYHSGSATPTGAPMALNGGTVALEPGIKDDVAHALVEMGHQVVQSIHGFGGYQAIMIDPKSGMLHGASEPRKDGCAIGY